MVWVGVVGEQFPPHMQEVPGSSPGASTKDSPIVSSTYRSAGARPFFSRAFCLPSVCPNWRARGELGLGLSPLQKAKGIRAGKAHLLDATRQVFPAGDGRPDPGWKFESGCGSRKGPGGRMRLIRILRQAMSALNCRVSGLALFSAEEKLYAQSQVPPSGSGAEQRSFLFSRPSLCPHPP